jgi:FlaA1/EpsC-like NDP-sugar epimerase
MEDHPSHAVNNNLFGAKSIADASLAVGVERFVMISTDKAVNPRNVMGATKRFAELYVRSRNSARSATRFCMVRFGNVLGSACSVLPIWSRQLSDAAPITVTHPEMTRFFMTIPEAAQLVIQAGALSPAEANGADIFVLDMGAPVRIIELAERFIRAQGLNPVVLNRPADADRLGHAALASDRSQVPIIFTGPRPGEKLHEELAHATEALRPTPAPGVLAWAGPPTDPRLVSELVETLSSVRFSADNNAVLDAIARFTPGFPGRNAQDQTETAAGPLRTTLAAAGADAA